MKMPLRGWNGTSPLFAMVLVPISLFTTIALSTSLLGRLQPMVALLVALASPLVLALVFSKLARRDWTVSLGSESGHSQPREWTPILWLGFLGLIILASLLRSAPISFPLPSYLDASWYVNSALSNL